MKITGNKNVDTVILLGSVGAIGYIGYKLFTGVVGRFEAPTGQTVEQPQGCNIPTIRALSIRKSMDTIYGKHVGSNFWNYPEVVNVILSYDLCDLKYANSYFLQTYGQTLYANIYNEWDTDGDYDAAENWLINNGLGF